MLHARATEWASCQYDDDLERGTAATMAILTSDDSAGETLAALSRGEPTSTVAQAVVRCATHSHPLLTRYRFCTERHVSLKCSRPAVSQVLAATV
jgi:hypothetical protein